MKESLHHPDWKEVEQYIYQDLRTGKYHFEDETNNFDDTPYDTQEQAVDAMKSYAEWLNRS